MKLKRLISFEKYLNKLNSVNNNKYRFGQLSEQNDCPICFEPFNIGQICTNECGHNFHCECIQSWVDMPGPAKTCPLCRKNITVVMPNNVSDDSGYETDPEYGSRMWN